MSTNPTASNREPGRFHLWRDIDSSRWNLGACIWSTGCEFRIGKRLYRMRWSS